MKGNATFRPRKIGSVRAKRQKKSTPTARTATAGGPRLKRSKKSEIKVVIQLDRKGETDDGKPCSLVYNRKTLRYNLRIGERLVISWVSHAACLQAAKALGVTWEDER